jgi:hypothetical protein
MKKYLRCEEFIFINQVYHYLQKVNDWQKHVMMEWNQNKDITRKNDKAL